MAEDQGMVEIIDDDAVAEAWLRPEDGDDDQPRPQHSNRASKAGHECDRFLVLSRTHYQLKRPPSRYLKAIFKRGNLFERPVAQAQMLKAGWDLFQPQASFTVEDKETGETLYTAHIDGVVRKGNGPLYVWESKVINEHDWEKIPRGLAGYRWLRESSKPWLRGYPAQVMSYMHAKPEAASMGLLHFVNAATLLPKFVYVPFDTVYVGEILDRARRINAAVKAVKLGGGLPAPIEWSESVCGRCEMLNACLPDQARAAGGLDILEDERFEALLEEDREAAAEAGAAKKRYDELHDRVKHLIGARNNVMVGRWWVTQKTINVAERLQKATSYTRLDIKPMADRKENAA